MFFLKVFPKVFSPQIFPPLRLKGCLCSWKLLTNFLPVLSSSLNFLCVILGGFYTRFNCRFVEVKNDFLRWNRSLYRFSYFQSWYKKLLFMVFAFIWYFIWARITWGLWSLLLIFVAECEGSFINSKFATNLITKWSEDFRRAQKAVSGGKQKKIANQTQNGQKKH